MGETSRRDGERPTERADKHMRENKDDIHRHTIEGIRNR